uniref:Reverse transcriptase domain-containing protein n=1 Tax=Angiostrongylus cantonensis TaxID=6313 RepID=A0A158P5T6_ANGCA
MRILEWDNMGVKIGDRQLHHLRFANDFVHITTNTSKAERVLANFDKSYGKIGLRRNLTKTIYVYLCREINMMNVLAPELSRTKQAAWGAFKSIEDVVKRTKNTRLRAHLFDSTVLPAITYASETWSLRKQDERSLSVIERAVERTMLGVSRFAQVKDGIRSSDLRQRSKIKDAVLYAKQSKIRWAGHVMRMNDNQWTRAVSDWLPGDVKCTAGRPPTR